jgi:hypothetical protein
MRLPSNPWPVSDETRPSIGRLLKFQFIDPARLSAYNVLRLAPRARKPSAYLRRIRKPAGLLFGATGPERTPATFRVPFLCAVRSRRLSSMPFNPDATHSPHPRYPSLAPVRGHCGLSGAALEDSGVIRAARNRRFGCTGVAPGGARSGKRGWCSPFTRRRRGRRRRVRVSVARHSGQTAASLPSPQKRHSESVAPAASKACCSASPSPQRDCGRRVRQEANTLLMRPADGSHRRRAVFAALTCFKISPRRACFVLRRRAGPLRLRLRWGRRYAAPWKDSTIPQNTTNNHRHLPNTQT